jgi:putative nucleotidyltransferase with HDIG domain
MPVGNAAVLGDEPAGLLHQAFGIEFTILDGGSGDVLSPTAGAPACDWSMRGELCREISRRNRPELLDDEDPLVVWGIPLTTAAGDPCVAAAPFVVRQVAAGDDLSRAATALGLDTAAAAAWAIRQPVWPIHSLRHTTELMLAQAASLRRIVQLEGETRSLSDNLASTYEEICLLYRLTQNLKLSESDEELGRVALEWMEEVVPAAGLAILYMPRAEGAESFGHEPRREPALLAHGNCPIDSREFSRLIEHLKPQAIGQPVVVNRPVTAQADWPCPQVRQMIAVSLSEGENLFGWLAVFNHRNDGEFGTVEASLLSSVAAILGIHSGNIALYQQQAELMAGIVRALTAAIDAKDPYTCGHSDRVARLSVRLAGELGCDAKTLNTMYLSGLLHDIGKIGVDDSVLRKPGKLSDAEYDHIKRHSEIGHKILRDLRKLDDVLPVILHHHESWDGSGYPGRLQSDAIPLPARIVAVADAFDAMGSDRPYRKRMPDEKIDEIFRAGMGKQWDAQVVNAFFRLRDEIRRIAANEQT